MRYYVGTRGSKLALVQTNYVIDRLEEAYPEDEFESVVIKTTGDIQADRQLDKIGSKGIFVKEIEEELADGRIQLAVPKGYAGGTGSRTDLCQSLEA